MRISGNILIFLAVSHSVIKKTGSALRLMKMEWNIFTIILTRMSL